MNEADYKRKLVAEVNVLRGGYARRYEDRWAIGLLDLMIKLPAYPPVWAEGKIIKGNVFGPTERQLFEGNHMRYAGLRVLLIGWKEKVMAICEWAEAADIRDCFTGSPHASTLEKYLNEPR